MTQTVGAAQLAITADATGVEAGVSKAKKTLASLGPAAKAAGKEAAAGVDQIGKGGDQASAKLDRATKSMIASIQRTTASLESGSRSSSKFFETLAAQRGVSVDTLRPYLQQLDAASTKQAAAATAARAMAPAITQVGMSAKQTTAALRQVPAQFTDIVTSLAAGQNPMQVFIQQGGQLKDVFGGIGPAARALGGYVFGLITPLTLAAGAVAALGLAYFQGAREAQNYAKAIILTGNAAGLTVGQMQRMAERISDVTGTQAAAAEALAQVVQSGTLAGDSIERFTLIAIKMEKETGQAISETIKQFQELGKSPVDASAKLNEATNFLTASVAQQIRALEEQGRVSDAAALAQTAYADALESRLGAIQDRLGLVEKAWRGIVSGAKAAWDAMLNVGRAETLEQQLENVSREIEKARQPFDPSAFGGNAEARAKLKDNLALQASLQEQIRLMRRGAEAQAEQSKEAKAQLAWDKTGEQFVTKKARMEQEIARARNEGLAAGKSQIEIEQRIAAIREKYTDKGAGRKAESERRASARASLGLDIETIRGEAEQLVGVYTASERMIESLRQNGLVSDREYYESKKAFIRLEADAKDAALTAEVGRYKQEKLQGADKLTNDKKIADAEAKLAILRADTSAKLEDLSNQQIQATRREVAEFRAAQQAAEDYFQALQRRQSQELSGVGKGRRQRDLERGEFGIREEFGGQRRRLENDRAQQELLGTFDDDARQRYENRLRILDEYEARELASWTEFNQQKLAAEQDWLNGAQEALQNYVDQTRNVAGDIEQIMGNAFSSLEDALVQFVQTGKLNFSQLVRSILADVARLQARKVAGQLAEFLASAIGSMGGGGGGSGYPDDRPTRGGRAIGGPVSAGGMYRVNERNPELLNVGGKQFLMMGNQSGSVKPGGGSIHIVNNTQGRVDRVEERTTDDGDRVLVLEEAMVRWLGDPNSRVSRSLGRNTTAGRRRA